ncbi:MAG: hypothetical protein PVI21_03900 [Candidatus Woesebacteria bacterium]|jgi:hypothetical protein
MRYPTNVDVFDLATLTKAFAELDAIANTGVPWTALPGDGNGAMQRRFLRLYSSHLRAVKELSGLRSLASGDADVLNQFLTDNGFTPMFRRLERGGVGAVAILEMMLKWAAKASRSVITLTSDNRASYQAFSLLPDGFEVFDSDAGRLVRLLAQDGSSVWLLIADRPGNCLDMVDVAMRSMRLRRRSTEFFPSVEVPCVDIDKALQLPWMLGMRSGDHVIDQAFQIFKLTMDEVGAEVRVASGLATTRGGGPRPLPLRIDRPFIGWFTQRGSEFPIATFYAGLNAWRPFF